MVARRMRPLALCAAVIASACGPSRPVAAPAVAGSAAQGPSGALPSDTRASVAKSASPPETGASTDEDASEEDEAEGPVDDAFDLEPPPDATIALPHPLADVSDAELEHRLVTKPASLGSMSIGKPSAGLLFNGAPMPPGDGWTVVAPGQSFGTQETIDYLEAAIRAVNSEFPNSQKLSIGDISARSGGYLSPHLSHQSGRDADVGYYYLDGGAWYRRATAQNLDTARTWALVRALVTRTDVEMLLIDRSIQALLRTEAERLGEDGEWLSGLFKGKGPLPPIIRHAPGHATHLHVRFFSPIAQETGRRAYAALLRHQLIRVGPVFAIHVARKGDTLAELAKRYGTTVRAIKQANGLKSNVIQAKKSYRIPEKGKAPPSLVRGPTAIPPRRLPPQPASGRSASQ